MINIGGSGWPAPTAGRRRGTVTVVLIVSIGGDRSAPPCTSQRHCAHRGANVHITSSTECPIHPDLRDHRERRRHMHGEWRSTTGVRGSTRCHPRTDELWHPGAAQPGRSSGDGSRYHSGSVCVASVLQCAAVSTWPPAMTKRRASGRGRAEGTRPGSRIRAAAAPPRMHRAASARPVERDDHLHRRLPARGHHRLDDLARPGGQLHPERQLHRRRAQPRRRRLGQLGRSIPAKVSRTTARVDWFRREPGGTTIFVKPTDDLGTAVRQPAETRITLKLPGSSGTSSMRRGKKLGVSGYEPSRNKATQPPAEQENGSGGERTRWSSGAAICATYSSHPALQGRHQCLKETSARTPCERFCTRSAASPAAPPARS